MRKSLLLLRTPPPYGGGELQQEKLRQHYSGKEAYIVFEMTSRRRTKVTQGVFELWKIGEFLLTWLRISWLMLFTRPRLFFMATAKGFFCFLRDSILVWTAWILRVPIAAELHGINYYFLSRGGFYAWYGRLVLSRIVSIRVLGESISHSLAEYGITNTIVIENGVESGATVDFRKLHKGPEINLLFVGTLSHEKGFEVLVETCGILRREGVLFKVHCMGQWESRKFKDEMIIRLQEYGMEENFVFHGLILGQKKWKVFSECQVLILPSRVEGQPLAILEGLSFGMVIVASNVGAIPDTIQDGENGFLVPYEDPERYAKILCKISRDNDLVERIRSINLDLFARRFSLERMLTNHERWLESCCKPDYLPNGAHSMI